MLCKLIELYYERIVTVALVLVCSVYTGCDVLGVGNPRFPTSKTSRRMKLIPTSSSLQKVLCNSQFVFLLAILYEGTVAIALENLTDVKQYTVYKQQFISGVQFSVEQVCWLYGKHKNWKWGWEFC